MLTRTPFEYQRPSNFATPWTDPRVDALKQLWAIGISAAAIARELGGGISRNAVIGKVHRLGLDGRKTSLTPEERELRRRIRKERQQQRDRLRPHRYRSPNAPIPEIIPQPDFKHVSFADLAANHCRFIHGNDPKTMTYCGHEKRPGSSYCAYHHHIAWRAV